jgi:hypothetical protein
VVRGDECRRHQGEGFAEGLAEVSADGVGLVLEVEDILILWRGGVLGFGWDERRCFVELLVWRCFGVDHFGVDVFVFVVEQPQLLVELFEGIERVPAVFLLREELGGAQEVPLLRAEYLASW